MTIYDDSRASWGAAANTNPRPVPPSSRIGISWHYDGGSALNLAGGPHSACLARVKADQTFHMSPARGWADIGYNALVCQHGRVIEGRGFDLQGAHSPGVNFEHYGVQFMVGGAESPTPAAYARAVHLASDLAAHSGHALRQWGHRDDPAASTDCPGSLIESWVHDGGPTSTAPSAPTTTTGGLSMSDVSDILARLDKLDAAVAGFRSEEAGRYVSASNRNSWLVGLLNGIAAKTGATVDEQALAAQLLAGLAPQVHDAVVAAGQPSEVADAVIAKLGAVLNPPAPTA